MDTYRDLAQLYQTGYADLAELQPKTAAAFGRLVMDATAAGELPTKFKELTAFAIAVACRCRGSIAHHAEAVFREGATRQEVAEMIGVAILMGGGLSTAYGVEALRAFDEVARAES